MEKEKEDQSRMSTRANAEGRSTAESNQLISQAAQRTEHTPGPWSVSLEFNAGQRDGVGYSIYAEDVDLFIADVWDDFEAASADEPFVAGVPPFGTATANAHLIAAAPDLLDALKIANASLKNLMNAVAHHEYTSSATQDWVERQQAQGLMKIGDTIAAAIAKAEGQ